MPAPAHGWAWLRARKATASRFYISPQSEMQHCGSSNFLKSPNDTTKDIMHGTYIISGLQHPEVCSHFPRQTTGAFNQEVKITTGVSKFLK